MSDSYDKVCLVGHPYAPIGMGEHVRCTYRALRSVALRPTLADIYKYGSPSRDELSEFSGACTDRPSDINIFHINGDEVDHVLTHLSQKQSWDGYNIVYPLWELAKYPIEWARQLDRFDEIWAPSRFIYDSLRGACTKPVIHMPLACDVVLTSFLGRRYFGIPETDYTFLFFYDLRSYTTRKNPQAIVKAFRTLLTKRPYSKAHLVIKINGVETNPNAFHQVSKELSDLKGHVTLFQRVMTNNEVKNLVRCCDCFVSLHRSEGYGFGIAEAMVLGKPVIATAFSGNMDFMDPSVSYGIGYSLVSLNEGDYPHYQDQVWAEPDWEEAASCMATLIDDPEKGRDIGKHASLHMKKNFGYRATGLRYLDRIEKILQNRGSSWAGMATNYSRLESISKESENKLYQALQEMALDDVGALMLDPLDQYPSLKAALPVMPPDEIQIAWTGTSGNALLKQSISFIRAVAEFYEQNTGRHLQNANILDYGCGWGRLIRLLYKFSSPENIYGCDAWERSLNLCKDFHVRANLRICDEIPQSLPFDRMKFDLIYAFSVFTHLSERTSLSVISALRSAISSQGLLAVTTRPIEYWDSHSQKQNKVDIEKMKNEHRKCGFAFTPHGRPPINGEVTYGDTSISLEYISKHWDGWQIVGERLCPADPHQRIVFLKPT